MNHQGAASQAALPLEQIRHNLTAGPFLMTLHAENGLDRFTGGARPLTDANPMPAPVFPDGVWQVRARDRD